MTTTEDRLARALGTAAARVAVSPDLPATVARGRRLRRRQVRTTVVACVLGVSAVVAVGLQASQSTDTSDHVGRTKASLVPAAASPLSARARSAYASIGSDVFVWGGSATAANATSHYVGPTTPTQLLSDGAVYHAATQTWQRLSPSPLRARENPVAVTVAGRVLVLGGDDGPTYLKGDQNGLASAYDLRTGAVYDPADDSWTAIPTAPLCAADAAVVHDLVLAVGNDCLDNGHTAFASYDPVRQVWTSLAAPAWTLSQLVGTPSGVVGVGASQVDDKLRTAFVQFDLASGRWSELPAPGGNDPLNQVVLVQDGSRVLAVSGTGSPGAAVSIYSLTDDGWQRVGHFRAGGSTGYLPGTLVVTADRGMLALREDRTLVWYSTVTHRDGSLNIFGSYGAGYDPSLAPLMPVGNHRYLLWGGRDLDVVPGTQRPLRDGAVLTLP